MNPMYLVFNEEKENWNGKMCSMSKTKKSKGVFFAFVEIREYDGMILF
jgi:hypothetical protein